MTVTFRNVLLITLMYIYKSTTDNIG